ncbi:MAG: PD-(D/E)XK nuclease family protein [Anaerolineaceae bacterium]|jgi:hypothetical protein|nr:MAG: PD-(D/E)XK nuclease family protein [Anaerolineaceae bacterium]
MNFHQSFQQIQILLSSIPNDGDLFVETLRQEHLPHLSFSQISTIEFCPYRYYLQYIRFQQPEPLPDYFTKGKLLHKLIAQFYQSQKDGNTVDLSDLESEISLSTNNMNHAHIVNALQLHFQNRWCDYEIVAVEHPFVLSISDDLPPMVGVIDLILQGENGIVLVDHKTGRDFYPYDELQVAIYSQYIRKMYGDSTCRLFYDHYRWVENLGRIRKPAFQRSEVSVEPSQWAFYLNRIQTASEKIQLLQSGEQPSPIRACFCCPYRQSCEHAF